MVNYRRINMKKYLFLIFIFNFYLFYNRDLHVRDLETVDFFVCYFSSDFVNFYVYLSGWEAERKTPDLRLY